MVFQYVSRTHIRVSQVLARDAGMGNLSNFERPFDIDVGRLRPTPLSILVALAVCNEEKSPVHFPRTSERTREEIHEEDQEYRGLRREPNGADPHLPPRGYPSELDSTRGSTTGSRGSSFDDFSIPWSETPRYKPASSGSASDSSSTHTTRHNPALPISLDRYQTCEPSGAPSQLAKLDLSPDCLEFRTEPRAPNYVGLGAMSREMCRGRLWTVYEGTLSVSNKPASALDSPLTKASTPPLPPPQKITTVPCHRFSPLPSSTHNAVSDLSSPPSQRGSSSWGTSQEHSDGSDTSWDTEDTPPTSPQGRPARTTIDVVFKVAQTKDFRDLPHDQLVRGEYTPSMAKDAIINEADLYCCPLAPLQGVTIPRFYGLFHCPYTDTWIMVLEQVGPAICSHGELKRLLTEHKWVI